MNNITQIDALERELHRKETAALDDGRVREDLMGLIADIRSELKQRVPGRESLIYEYEQLLEREAARYSPRQAYEAGALLATNPGDGGKEQDRAFMRYVCRVSLDPEAQALQREVQRMYDELRGFLDDASGLVSEFTELYRRCCSTTNRLHHFFDLGYEYMDAVMKRADAS